MRWPAWRTARSAHPLTPLANTDTGAHPLSKCVGKSAIDYTKNVDIKANLKEWVAYRKGERDAAPERLGDGANPATTQPLGGTRTREVPPEWLRRMEDPREALTAPKRPPKPRQPLRSALRVPGTDDR